MGSLLPNTQKLDAFAALLADARGGLAVLDALPDAAVITDADGTVRYVNVAARRLLGVAQAGAVGLPVNSILALLDGDTHQPILEPLTYLLGSASIGATGRHDLLALADSAPMPFEYSIGSISAQHPSAGGFVLLLRKPAFVHGDTQDLSRAVPREKHGPLLNRDELIECLIGVCRSMEPDDRHSLLVMGLEGFKSIYEHVGDVSAEAVLREVVARIRARVRAHDALAYLGGGFFGLLAAHCSFARPRAEAMQAALANQPFDVACGRYTRSVNIGIAAIRGRRHDAGAAITAATAACRRAMEDRETTLGICETILE